MLNEWAIVDLMGHKRLAGLVTEEEIAGAKMLRLDAPVWRPATGDWDPASVSTYFRAETIYMLTPCTQETVQRHVKASTPVYSAGWRELPAADGDYEIEGERSTIRVNQTFDAPYEQEDMAFLSAVPSEQETAAHLNEWYCLDPETDRLFSSSDFASWTGEQRWEASMWAATRVLRSSSVHIQLSPLPDSLRDLFARRGIVPRLHEDEVAQ